MADQKMVASITTCKDCYKTKLQKPNCDYEHAKDYQDTYEFFRNKWNEEFPQLLQAAQALKPATDACKAERNAALPILQQQQMMKEMSDMVLGTKTMIDNFIESMGGGKAKKAQTTAKESANTSNGNTHMWRPDVKDENVQNAIDELKAKHPELNDSNIEVMPNRSGAGHKSIRYKLPS